MKPLALIALIALILAPSLGAARQDKSAASAPIGQQPAVREAVRAVEEALKAEPPSAATRATGATAAALATTPDDEICSMWLPGFRSRYGEMVKADAKDPVLIAMEQLLNRVQVACDSSLSAQSRSSASQGQDTDVVLIDVPPDISSELAAQWAAEVIVEKAPLGAQYGLQPQIGIVFVSPRKTDVGGPIVRDRMWYFGIGDGRAVGISEDDGQPRANTVVVDPELEDWIEVTEGPSRPPRILDPPPPTFTSSSNPNLRFRIPANVWALGRAVDQILPKFLRTLPLASSAGSKPRRQNRLWDNAKVEEDDQGQASIVEFPAGRFPNTPSFDPVFRPDLVPRFGSTAPSPLLWASLGFTQMLTHVSSMHAPMPAAPEGVRLSRGRNGELEYWIDPMPRQAVSKVQSTVDVPQPSLKVFLKSLGRSTGRDAVQAIFVNDGNVPVQLIPNEVFTVEPLANVTEQQFARELAQSAGARQVTMNLPAYCLQFRKDAPTAGRIYRVASRAAQAQVGPVRRILHAAERLRRAGRLTPDSDAEQYFHSIRQWAIWTREQTFNERSFAEALLEHTRKNVVAAGRRWDRQLEAAARGIIPNRWRDVQQVLAEEQRVISAVGRQEGPTAIN